MKLINRITLILILSLFYSCTKKDTIQEVKKNNEVITFTPSESIDTYIKHPNKEDTLCNKDIARAKRDLNIYSKIYVQIFGEMSCCKIYNKELEKLAIKKGYIILHEEISDVLHPKQMQGCYSAYVKSIMQQRLGENYLEKLETEADSLLIENIKNKNRIVSIYELRDNQKPYIIKDGKVIGKEYLPNIKTKLKLKQNIGNYLFLDLQFIINKKGNIHDLKVTNWVNEYPENEKYRKKLEKIAKDTILKNYNNWHAGNYKGNLVSVENSFRITFE
jgi:hypothetical protein